jgi:hypothetical protein
MHGFLPSLALFKNSARIDVSVPTSHVRDEPGINTSSVP